MRLPSVLGALVLISACSGSGPADAEPATETTTTTGVGATSSTTTTSAETTTTTTEPAVPALRADHGVSDAAIRIGISTDLSGPRAEENAAILDAQVAYFDTRNDDGGIAGRRVELVVRDSASDLATHMDNYAELSEASDAGVVLIASSGSDEETAAIAGALVPDSLAAIAGGSSVAWIGGGATDLVFEIGVSTCVEAMNGIELLAARSVVDEPRVAIVSRPGDYGSEGAAGARHAATELGLEIVADLDGRAGPEALAAVVEELVEAEPDIVWVTVSPSELAQLIVGATAGGLDAIWSGNAPAYSSTLLSTSAAPVLSERYLHSARNQLWGTESEPMVDVMADLRARLRDRTHEEADALLTGWIRATAAEAILQEAADAGDMTRAGVVEAARRVEVAFEGIGPAQSWPETGDEIVRQSYLYEVDAEQATLDRPIGESGSTGLRLARGPFTGGVARTADVATVCGGLPG